jgi:predicted acyltransferase
MSTKRLVALDVLRGLTIALMIMVNTPGSWAYVYPPLRHAQWHGCTPTDLVFPFFLFIVGVSMWYSFKKFGTGISQQGLQKVVKRTLIIFLLGLLLNLFPYFNFEKVRIFGVLQRIALAYGVGAFICMFFNVKKLKYVVGIILFGYWGLLYLGNPESPFELAGNIVRKFDLWLLGEGHIYKGFGIPFDPEGLISTIPAIATVILGYITGSIIERSKSTLTGIKKLIAYGIVAVILGWFWGMVLPINKPIWTSSYVLYTAGWAMLVLAGLLFLIDEKKLTSWAKPFVHFGMNPLFIFVFSGLYVKSIIYLVKFSGSDGEPISGYQYLFTEIFKPVAGNMNGSLLFAIAHIVVFWFLTFLMYRKRIFIKI